MTHGTYLTNSERDHLQRLQDRDVELPTRTSRQRLIYRANRHAWGDVAQLANRSAARATRPQLTARQFVALCEYRAALARYQANTYPPRSSARSHATATAAVYTRAVCVIGTRDRRFA